MIGWEEISSRCTKGGSISRGNTARVWSTFWRTSSVTFCRSWPSSNWITVVEAPLLTTDSMDLMLEMPATASSMGRVTWVSSSAGAAPLSVIVTVTAGKTMLGKRLIGSML